MARCRYRSVEQAGDDVKGGFVADDEWCEFCGESLPCSCFEDDEGDDWDYETEKYFK